MGLFKSSDMKKECNKAAQILKSFTEKNKIPPHVISNAKGLAIFSAIRAGMYLAGSGGSGVVVARLSDGSWSAPSAFSVRAGSIGLVYGIDVYDCVCVLNTVEAVEAYTNPETKLGGSLALAAGPIGGNALTFTDKDARQHPVWTYTRSKGLYGGLTVDGTSIKEKREVNEAFYGESVTAAQILGGQVQILKTMQTEMRQLTEVLKVAEGKTADKAVLQDVSTEPTPGELTE